MEVDGVFRCEVEMNGRYSFKSLLLDGQGIDEAGMDGPQLVMAGDLEVVEDSLYRDDIMGGKESFKSLLLDGESREEDESEFSPSNQKVGNSNRIESLVVPTTTGAAGAAVLGGEQVESFFDQKGGISPGNGHVASDSGVHQHGVDSFMTPESIQRVRKRSRGASNKSSGVTEGNLFPPSSIPLNDLGINVGQGTEIVPRPKAKKQQVLKTPPPSGNKKQVGSHSEVQKLLDSVIGRQEMFFADLLESMDRREAIRERMRDDKEEKWRAEERAQLGLFNKAIVALTQELLGESASSKVLTDIGWNGKGH